MRFQIFVVKQKTVVVTLIIAIVLANNGMVPCQVLKRNWLKEILIQTFFVKKMFK